MKICSNCNVEKSITQFRKMKRKRPNNSGWYEYVHPQCRDCENLKNRNRYDKGGKESWAETRKKWHVQKCYGLSAEDLYGLYEKQDQSCAICKTALVITGDNANNVVCVDHCHDTGKVRGLLCRQCNAGLGQFRDDISLIEKALKYLHSE